jgi:hypothetical protein
MKFRVESTGFKLSPSLKNFAKEKLGYWIFILPIFWRWK